MNALLSLEEARARVLAAAQPLSAEPIELIEAAGRRLARPVVAGERHPAADNAAMDGYALRAADAARGAELTVIGESRTGHDVTALVGVGQAVRIFTGALLPAGADAVLVQEAAEPLAEGRVRCLATVAPGANVRRAGEEYEAGDELLAAGTRLTPAAIGLLASTGLTEVLVTRRPRVALAVIGDELSADDAPRLAHRHDSNGPMIAAACRAMGLEAAPGVTLGDDAEAVAAWLTRSLDGADLVITCGSASVGAHDVVAAAWERAGVAAQFARVAIKPGKPARFGRAAGALVFALPGNPLACLTAFEQLVEPAIAVLGGGAWQPLPRVRLPLAAAVRTGHDTLYLLRAGRGEAGLEVPARQGAAMLREAATQTLIAELPGGLAVPAGRPVEALALPGALDGGVWRPALRLPAAVGVRGPGSDAGKTLLIEQLLPVLTALGVRVGTIKHAHHDVDPDTPGKDSHRHFAAGAQRVLLLAPGKSALFARRDGPRDDLDGWLESFAGAADLVLIEGFSDEPLRAVRIEPRGEEFGLDVDSETAPAGWTVRRPSEPGADWRYPDDLVRSLAEQLAALADRP
jgi:molybdopterin molybdotransferase